MPKNSKTAIQRIDSHEKLCRIMQKQTFQRIEDLHNRIARLEKVLITGSGAIIITLLMNMIQ
jgi:hypothetical protein